MGKRKNTSTADSKPKESGHASSSESLKNADENNEMKEEQEDPVMDSADSQAETSDSLPANDGPESAFAGLKKKKKKLVESSSLNDERVDAGEDLDEHVNDEEEVERRVLQQQRYPWEGSDTDHIYDEASSPDVYEDREAREVCKKLVSTRNEVDVSGLKSAWSMKRTSWRDHRFNIMPPQYRQGKLGNCLSVAVWRMWYAHVKLHQLDRGKLTEIQLRNERRGSESFEPICEYMKKNGFVDDMFIHKRPSSGSVEENEKFDTLLKRLYKQGPVAVEFIPCQSYLGANGMGIICPTSYERCRQHYEFFTTHIALLTGHGIHFGCDNPMKFWEIYESRGETFGDGGFITLAQGMGLIQTAVEMKFYDTGYNFEEEGLNSDDSHDQDESKDDDGSKSRGRIHESIEDGINACQDLENFLHNILPESGSQDHFIRIDEGTVTDDENDFGDGLKAGRYSVCLMEGSFDHLSESELRVKLEENLDKEYSILLIHYPEELKGAVYVIIEKPANSVLHQLPWNLVGSMATTIIECKPKNSVFGPLLEQALNDEDEETAKSEASNKRKRKKKNGGSTGTPQPAKTAKKSPVNANESPKSGGQSSGGSNKKQFNSGKQFGSNSKGKGKGKGRA